MKQYEQSQGLNKNWTLIADQILSEAKDSSSFLQSLSRRIALYRSKIQQEDLIDVLLKEQKNIMKEIQLEMALKKKETKGTKNSMMDHAEGSDNVYFSWKKKKEMENKLNLQKEDNKEKKEKTSNSPKPGNNYKNQSSSRMHTTSLKKPQSQ